MAREPESRPEGESMRREFVDLPGRVPQRGDADIATDVESTLFYDKLVRSYGIKIKVDQGIVTLLGTVNGEYEKRRAIEDAQKVHGVRQVIDQLQIAREAS